MHSEGSARYCGCCTCCNQMTSPNHDPVHTSLGSLRLAVSGGIILRHIAVAINCPVSHLISAAAAPHYQTNAASCWSGVSFTRTFRTCPSTTGDLLTFGIKRHHMHPSSILMFIMSSRGAKCSCSLLYTQTKLSSSCDACTACLTGSAPPWHSQYDLTGRIPKHLNRTTLELNAA